MSLWVHRVDRGFTWSAAQKHAENVVGTFNYLMLSCYKNSVKSLQLIQNNAAHVLTPTRVRSHFSHVASLNRQNARTRNVLWTLYDTFLLILMNEPSSQCHPAIHRIITSPPITGQPSPGDLLSTPLGHSLTFQSLSMCQTSRLHVPCPVHSAGKFKLISHHPLVWRDNNHH